MKFCICNIAWDKAEDEQMYRICSEMEYDGIEIAPTRIFPENPYEHLDDAGCWARNLADKYGLKVYSCQSIWYGRKENIFGNEKERKCLLEHSKRAFSFAEVIGAENVVFGCPKNRNGYGKKREENSWIAMDFFRKMAEIAREHGIVLSIEANPSIYGTDFLNNTQEALTFVNCLSVDSIKLNLDTGTMLCNAEKLKIVKGYEHMIGHVHISEPHLTMIKERKE